MDIETFGGEVEVISEGTGVLDRMTLAEIDMSMLMSRRYPRNIRAFVDAAISTATVDVDTAEQCFYSLSRSGKTIKGPSVRLAEIAVACYGNIRASTRVIGETEDGRMIKAVGTCHDMQNNVHVQIEAVRRIVDKNGNKYSDDMIAVTANAAMAIGYRNAAFKVIPQALIRSIYRECIKVATGNAKSISEKRHQVLDRLQKLSPEITTDRVISVLGRQSVEEITLDDLAHLIGLGTAIKDGLQDIDEAFPRVVEKKKAGRVIGSVGKAKGEEEVSAESSPAQTSLPGDDARSRRIGSGRAESLIAVAREIGIDAEALQRMAAENLGVDKPLADLTESEANTLDEMMSEMAESEDA